MALIDEDIVISGISGRFADADSLSELSEKLFSGKQLVTDDPRKLTKGFYEDLPDRNGKLKSHHNLFDYTYFGISKAVASAMDTMSCQLMERTFEALIDAGINPSDLRGTDSFVFTGTCHSDSDLEWSSNIKVGYGIMGRNRCMNSNRISYWLDLNGTSYATDSGWCNGISNLYHGWNAIRTGKTDTAIIGVCSLQKVALTTIQLKDFGVLSPDGFTRSFDDSANGWARSSAVVVLILQRASVAKRCYATIGHVYTSFVPNDNNVISQSTEKDWKTILTEFYEQSRIDPNDIYYVEAHGSGIKEEDAAELNALAEIFCKNRKSPLLVGCVKSNLGHSESAASFCGLAKAIISMEKGTIPMNLHYEKPNSLVSALTRGILKVVDSHTSLPPNAWIAINTHSFGGGYGHLVLKPNLKAKMLKNDGIPRLVPLADRTNDFMSNLFELVESVPYDPEFVALLHEIHSKKVERYFGRGYTILPKLENPVHESQVYNDEKRPVWFIFSGMGSQWPKMGKRLMDLPLFRESIEKSHKILESKGLDLIKIITDDDPNVFDNILNSFVGIAAVQIALIDVLRALKVTPDGLIGHSVGELGCSYADECFTAEQMILAAYYRGRASRESELIKGSMAAVGKGYNDMKDQLPEDVEIACHNAADSCTLSGPVESIEKFVQELKGKGIFAKAVNVSNIAYHSRYIKPAAPKLLKYLKEIVPEPKLRSSKWISTSNPEDKWDTDVAKYCSAEYHTNNLLSSVLFEEGSKHIPKNAICIEIAPHGLLQAILKRSLGDEVTNIPLTSRSSPDPLVHLLQAIGKMYMAGIDVSVMNLYPKVEFPVSRGTPFLSNLPHWHEQRLTTPATLMASKIVYSFKNQIMSVTEDGSGFIINGKNKYPLSVFLNLIWELFASQKKLGMNDCPVVIENFKIDRFVDIHLSDDDNKTVYFLIGCGDFEIVEENQFLSCGVISTLAEKPLPASETVTLTKPDLVGDEIYEELKRKGYAFGNSFKALTAVEFKENGILAEVPATSNWQEIIEAMVQLHLLNIDDSADFIYLPLSFGSLEISCQMHLQLKNKLTEKSSLTMVYDAVTNTVSCGGLCLKRLRCFEYPKEKSSLNFKPVNFFPFVNPPLQNVTRFVDYCFGVALDNMDSAKKLCGINVLEVVDKDRASSLGEYLRELHRDTEMKVQTISSPSVSTHSKETMDFVITPTTSSLNACLDFVVDGGFVFAKKVGQSELPKKTVVVAKFVDDSKQEYLLLRKNRTNSKDFELLDVDEETGVKLETRLRQLKQSEKVLLLTRRKPSEGVHEFKARMQAKTNVPLRWMFVLDPNAPRFNPEDPLYSEQLEKGLSTYVFNEGTWGTYHKYNFPEGNSESEINFNLDENLEIEPSYMGFEPSDNLIKLEQVEFSGHLNKKRVMGITKLENHRKIVMDKHLTWEIPESWSLEDGATVPVSYAMAYYCLVVLGRLSRSEKILITDAMSFLSQACISVALSLGSRVYVTVSSDKEATAVKKLFPQLKDSNIMNHLNAKRDVTWKLQSTGEPMDLVVNMLDGDALFAILPLVGEFGKIYHFGTEDLKKNVPLGTYMFLVTKSFFGESVDVLSRLSEDDRKTLHDLVAGGLKNGAVKPLPRMTTKIDQFNKYQNGTHSTRMKTLLQCENKKTKYIKFDSKKSYLVLGDETDIWVDVVEWLLRRKVTNVVVGRRDVTKRSQLRVPVIKSHHNVLICDHQNVEKLIGEARKMGPLSSVFLVSVNSADKSEILTSLDKFFRDSDSHLVAISKSPGYLSEMCSQRNKSGFPSTNFVWEADDMEIKANLESMSKLCGRDPVVHVTPTTLRSTIDQRLSDLLPSMIDDFCEMGASLKDHVEIVRLHTLTGFKRKSFPEITPFIIIPGLEKEPVKMLQPFVSNFIYPAACVRLPNMDLSMSQMVNFVLPEIVKFNKGNYYNLVGISSGSHLAMQVARELEKLGATVGLQLIGAPVQNIKSLVTKSLEWDLLNLIQGKFKLCTDSQAKNESSSELSWQGQLNTVLNALNLPPEEEKNFCKGATFIYNNLKALLENDGTSTRITGPFTVIVSDQSNIDDKLLSQICRSISIRSLPVSNDQLFASTDVWRIIHGSAIAQPMSKNTVHECSWLDLEDFMDQHEKSAGYQDPTSSSAKFSFSC